MNIPETLNLEYLEQQYLQWKSAPDSLSREWQFFFKGFEAGFAFDGDAEGQTPRSIPETEPEAEQKAEPGTPGAGSFSEADLMRQSNVDRLIYRYRDLGHLLACLDPLSACPTSHRLLELSAFDLADGDLEQSFYARTLIPEGKAPLKEIVATLKETYCRSIGVEYMHIQDPGEREWLQARMEPNRNRPQLEKKERVRIFEKLSEAALFEGFMNKKYIAQTRFSIEGADAAIPLLDALFAHFAARGGKEVVMGMAHRGRLSIQTNVLSRPYEEIFSQFEHCYDTENLIGSGDVKYHNGYLTNLETGSGKSIRAYMVDNPSHLESVDPVVEGAARALGDLMKERDRSMILPLLIHGDAAFAGQGIVPETLNISQLEGYRTGGTVHLIINNQIGYTTLPENARSTRYATDVAKMLMIPIFHVHGENPEAVVHVANLAAEYRREFAKDVVIDLICYRRYGHNEGDEPYFTQPAMYARIKDRPPVHRLYGDRLLEEGVIQQELIDGIEARVSETLKEAFDSTHGTACAFPVSSFFKEWNEFKSKYTHEPTETGVEEERLLELARKLNTLPEDFTPHRKLDAILKKRLEAVESGEGIDWANAEALSFASLLVEGIPIRLSGQDCQRGTFSQRHSVLVDNNSEAEYLPLNNLSEDQAQYRAYNSLLAEASILGFEYGYSLVQPKGLTLWEAQFGDFANNAQSIIDLYIASGQAKWQRLNGLVMLLPHGLEGLGPEHSSARPERFLQLCADDNMQVCNPTTPAQYFHLLRRQIKSPHRKPLIVLTPKSLLRNPQAVSAREAFTGGSFKEVIDDEKDIESPKRLLICSGKLYYELLKRREELSEEIAIIRLEQYYPFPRKPMEMILEKYGEVSQWCWVQEEPANMGAWTFIAQRLEILADRPIRYIGRKSSSSPATGFPKIYRAEQAAIVEEAVGPPPDQVHAAAKYQGG